MRSFGATRSTLLVSSALLAAGCVTEINISSPRRDAALPADGGTAFPSDGGAGRPDLGGADAGDAGAGLDGGTTDLGVVDQGAVDVGVLPRDLSLGTPGRPAKLIVPRGYDGTPYPLIVLMHGVGSNSDEMEVFLPIALEVDARGFFLLIPNGTEAPDGTRFWDATEQCCNSFTGPVDDVAYITGLIDEAGARFNVDPRRVYATGHSNGGFMSYRLACDAAERFAAVAPLAGMEPRDPAQCTPSEAVSILHAHGTQDRIIPYDGLVDGERVFPSVEETLQRWASRAGCTRSSFTEVGSGDLSEDVPGEETDIFEYTAGCRAGIEIRLWRMNRENHFPAFNANYIDRLLDFLLVQTKP